MGLKVKQSKMGTQGCCFCGQLATLHRLPLKYLAFQLMPAGFQANVHMQPPQIYTHLVLSASGWEISGFAVPCPGSWLWQKLITKAEGRRVPKCICLYRYKFRNNCYNLNRNAVHLTMVWPGDLPAWSAAQLLLRGDVNCSQTRFGPDSPQIEDCPPKALDSVPVCLVRLLWASVSKPFCGGFLGSGFQCYILRRVLATLKGFEHHSGEEKTW